VFSVTLCFLGRNKTTQACSELVEGRSAWWRFLHTPCTGCRKRLFSLALEKSYSGLRLLRQSQINQYVFVSRDVGVAPTVGATPTSRL